MKTIPILSALLALAALPALADPTAEAKAHSEAFARAMNTRDAKAMLALYADDARVIWPGEGEEASGRQAIEKLIASTLATLPKDARIALKSQQAIPLGANYIATVGRWEQSATGPDGKKEISEVRTTEVLEKRGGKTLYLVDHASAGVPPPPPPAPSAR
jgi:uncharacterized protein (TIGR02246 family)